MAYFTDTSVLLTVPRPSPVAADESRRTIFDYRYVLSVVRSTMVSMYFCTFACLLNPQ
jgi:hypothetical protein